MLPPLCVGTFYCFLQSCIHKGGWGFPQITFSINPVFYTLHGCLFPFFFFQNLLSLLYVAFIDARWLLWSSTQGMNSQGGFAPFKAVSPVNPGWARQPPWWPFKAVLQKLCWYPKTLGKTKYLHRDFMQVVYNFWFTLFFLSIYIRNKICIKKYIRRMIHPP